MKTKEDLPATVKDKLATKNKQLQTQQTVKK